MCHNLTAPAEALGYMKRLLPILVLQAALLCGAVSALAGAVCTRAGMGHHACCRHAKRAAGEMGAMPGMDCCAHSTASGGTSKAGPRSTPIAAVQGCYCLSRQGPVVPVLGRSVPARVQRDGGQTPLSAQAFVLGDGPAALLVNARQNAPPGGSLPLFVIHRVFRL